MGRRKLEVVEEEGEPVAKRDGSVVARGRKEVLKLLLTCPYCGARAKGAVKARRGYVYAWHSARGEKHMWALGPATPLLLDLLSQVEPRRFTLTEEDRQAAGRLAELMADCTLKRVLQTLSTAESVTVEPVKP
ncbi:MAG: hypothetical protein QXT37_10145 [Thermofilaceae archaeon]